MKSIGRFLLVYFFVFVLNMIFLYPEIQAAEKCAGVSGSGNTPPNSANVLVIYATFPDSVTTIPSEILNGIENKVPDFFSEMSYDVVDLTIIRKGATSTTAWVADYAPSHYASYESLPNAFGELYDEIFEKVYMSDSTAFDNDNVDVVAVISIVDISKYNGEAFRESYGFPGNADSIWNKDGFMVDTPYEGRNSDMVPKNFAHEYGHLLNDNMRDRNGGSWGQLTGIYDLMYHHWLGYGWDKKMRPLCSYDLYNTLGWITSSMVQTVTTNQSNIELKDIRVKPSVGEKVLCKIPLIDNRHIA